MSPRERTVHRCEECGAAAPRWSGRCAQCGSWNSLVEERVVRTVADEAAALLAEPVELAAISAEGGAPVPTGVAELDRALAGGLVPGSVTLIGGEPGVGKSTLLLQAAAQRAAAGGRVLLVSAEESPEQVRRRADRLGAAVEGVALLPTTSLSSALSAAERHRPDLLVVDSIQTVGDPGLGAPGSVAQVRECAARLVAFSKQQGVATVLVGHVTKEGSLAGPRVLEHLVDTVCSFEGERHHALRVLSVTKHRFGPTGELGIFAMGERGLESVADPSAFLLADRRPGVAGSVVAPVLEGRRPLLVEVQALVARSSLATPRRAAQGVVPGRLALLLAVLEQRAGCPFAGMDVFASAVGGIRVHEPASDLALGLALASASLGVPLGEDLVACGEVGLGGEVRQVAQTDRRLAEAARRG
ncbi:MAG: repair protein RadA, partial [Acidimicrobiaceae bacterium]|nr:repair protein RadA [Acidimicrobiaceae bacterium]